MLGKPLKTEMFLWVTTSLYALHPFLLQIQVCAKVQILN